MLPAICPFLGCQFAVTLSIDSSCIVTSFFYSVKKECACRAVLKKCFLFRRYFHCSPPSSSNSQGHRPTSALSNILPLSTSLKKSLYGLTQLTVIVRPLLSINVSPTRILEIGWNLETKTSQASHSRPAPQKVVNPHFGQPKEYNLDVNRDSNRCGSPPQRGHKECLFSITLINLFH